MRFSEPLPLAGVSFLTSVIHKVGVSKLCLWVATAAQGTTPSASGHKKTRCDSHIGLGDGGNLNMAQSLRDG